MTPSTVNIHEMNTGLFSPFTNRQYCAWFFYLMVAHVISILLILAVMIYIAASTGKFNSFTDLRSWYMLLLNLTSYFTNRLLYSMCLNSI
jgi:hypothetical protein